MKKTVITSFLNTLLLVLTKWPFPIVGYNFNSESSELKECLNQVCKNMCINKDCGPNANCIENEHMAFCSCRRGFTPSDYGCKPNGCRTDSDCSEFDVCLNQVCKNTCINKDCGPNANCFAHNHKAFCSCRRGFTTTSDYGCKPKGHTYEDPCEGSCDASAECRMYNNIPYCFCKPQQSFDGQRCSPTPGHSPSAKGKSCRGHNDCPSDRECVDNVCINPCSRFLCNKGLICVTRNHQPRCLVIRSSPDNKDILKKKFDDPKKAPKWISSLFSCWSQDMSLPSIESEYDNNVLRRHFADLKNRGVQFGRIWLGGRDFSMTKKQYIWTETGSFPVYKNWYTSVCPYVQKGYCIYSHLRLDNEENKLKWCNNKCDDLEYGENFFCQYYEIDL